MLYYFSTDIKSISETILEAYSKGVEFDTLLKRNTKVRNYWNDLQKEKLERLNATKRARERQEREAKARAIKQAAKQEALSKLTAEELEAFGLNKTKKRIV